MCEIDVGKCCDIDVQEQAIELLIRNHGGDVLWPQLFAFSRRQTCVARIGNVHLSEVSCLQVSWLDTKIFSCF